METLRLCHWGNVWHYRLCQILLLRNRYVLHLISFSETDASQGTQGIYYKYLPAVNLSSLISYQIHICTQASIQGKNSQTLKLYALLFSTEVAIEMPLLWYLTGITDKRKKIDCCSKPIIVARNYHKIIERQIRDQV